MHTYHFDLPVIPNPDTRKGGNWLELPIDIHAQFGVGRLKVHAHFDNVAYDGSIVASKNADGTKAYLIGIKKDILAQIGKSAGDVVSLTFTNAQLDASAQSMIAMLIKKLEVKGYGEKDFWAAAAWLFATDPERLQEDAQGVSYAVFLDKQNAIQNAADSLIKGKICGVNPHEVKDEVMRRCRLLDKLVDDVAKGKTYWSDAS